MREIDLSKTEYTHTISQVLRDLRNEQCFQHLRGMLLGIVKDIIKSDDYFCSHRYQWSDKGFYVRYHYKALVRKVSELYGYRCPSCGVIDYSPYKQVVLRNDRSGSAEGFDAVDGCRSCQASYRHWFHCQWSRYQRGLRGELINGDYDVWLCRLLRLKAAEAKRMRQG